MKPVKPVKAVKAVNADRAAHGLAPLLAAARTWIEGAGDDPDALTVPVPEPARGTLVARLRDRFGLSPFELAVVACAAAVELVPGFGARCAQAQGAGGTATFTPGLAIARLPGPDWSALQPDATLRRWRLLQCAPGDVYAGRSLVLPEAVLHFLLGRAAMDERLASRLRVVGTAGELTPSRQEAVRRVAGIMGESPAPHVQLVTPTAERERSLLAAVAARQGRVLWELPAWALPEGAEEREDFMWTCARDARLADALLMVDVSATSDPGRLALATDFLARLPDAAAVCGPEVLRPPGRTVVSLSLPRLGHDEATQVWRKALHGAEDAAQVDVAVLSAQFQLDADGIATAARAARHRAPGESAAAAVWQACRLLARATLDDLAQRIDADAPWDRLALPEEELRTLHAVAAQVRHRARVFHAWGLSAHGHRGGTSAIFSGPSGTGKTMAAEVLATDLGLDLYRIDLSSVVSKYIGETEKNLRRVFDAAEESGAILLFDEADALFGKRTEVKDSHDRHANIEVSYLLQRMEVYQGLAILTTNLRKNIDDAFLRRIQFVVEFPFPDAQMRERIWRGIFPPQMPLENVDPSHLARLAVAGGNIKNIARNAAYLAAGEDRPLGMPHLLDAARREYAKLGQALTAAEIRGWVR